MFSWVKETTATAVALLAVVGTAAAAPAQSAQTGATKPQAAGSTAAPATAPHFGFGRAAKPEEVAVWDIDVRPDGHGVKPGRGTVQQGQDVFDAQCASCHGTFGESNSYIALAGGVTKEDLKTGHAARLREADVPRTLGMKLNAATTLYDYIYRAMPWPNPASLSVNDTYAVTAYVLYLNEIVPADFELSDKNILTVPMPNRNGMTRNHGMGSVHGKPDVQGSLCMVNCATQVKIVSEMPEYALNSHGELSAQFSPYAPVVGLDTSHHAGGKPMAAAPAVAQANGATGNARELANSSACLACHGVDQKVVGPAFRDVGSKYVSRGDAENYIATKIKSGGVGVWGQVPMPAQTALKDDDARALARWILNGAN